MSMMLWNIYFRKGMVFVPTVVKTEAGFFMDIDPVAVVESTNRQELIDVIRVTILKGNLVVATPTRATFPKPAILNYANVKSWATFARKAFCWKITQIDSTFRLCPQRESPSKGWEDDQANIETFNGSTAIDRLSNAIADQIQALNVK